MKIDFPYPIGYTQPREIKQRRSTEPDLATMERGTTMSEMFTPWHVEDYINSDEDAIAYLNGALEEDDPAFVQDAFGVVARARGMTNVARKSGLGRESLYKALRPDSQPSFNTIMRVADALDAELYFLPKGIDRRKVYYAITKIQEGSAAKAQPTDASATTTAAEA